jgi:protein gp37
MGEATNISWADHTFNPWIGCTKVSVGPKGACEGCYAEAMMADRYHRVTWGKAGQAATYSRTGQSTWKLPRKWDRAVAKEVQHWRSNPFARAETPRPTRFVFCASLADVFDNQVPVEWRARLFDLIRITPHLTWLLLTKRPQNIAKLFAETITPELRKASSGPEMLGRSLWPRNAAIGCTVVTQAEADRDVPHLLAAKAGLAPAFAFLSMEPLMEAVDIAWAISPNMLDIAAGFLRRGMFSPGLETVGRVDWIITGGESPQGKHKARETPDGAFQAIRDQCAWANVPYHHKQNTGGKSAGRLLDGVIHDARPTRPEVK